MKYSNCRKNYTGKKSSIVKLKLHNTIESIKELPFDVVYIARDEDELRIIKSAFKSVFTFTPNEGTLAYLNKKLMIANYEFHPLERGFTKIEKSKFTYKKLKNYVGEITEKHTLCIPSLTVRFRGNVVNKYTVNKRFHTILEKASFIDSNALTDDTEDLLDNMKLSTNGKTLTPCLICNKAKDKFMDWNSCRLGSKECLENVYLSKKSTHTPNGNSTGKDEEEGEASLVSDTGNISAFRRTTLSIYEVSHDIHKDHKVIIDDMSMAFNLCETKNRFIHEWVHKRNALEAYNCFGIPKFDSKGNLRKIRPIQEPLGNLKNIHKTINRYLGALPTPNRISAYVQGRNTAHAANQHLRNSYWVSKEEFDAKSDFVTGLLEDNRYEYNKQNEVSGDTTTPEGYMFFQPLTVIRLDIKNYFNSIKESDIRNYFKYGVGYSHYVAGLLATLCTVKTVDTDKLLSSKFLPQGSPLSGSIANLVGDWKFGMVISAILELNSEDWVYTIYSDDIAISHPTNTISENNINDTMELIKKVVEDNGFKVNVSKTRVEDDKKQQVKYHGYTAYQKVDVPKEVRKSLKTLISKVERDGWESVYQDLDLLHAGSVEMYIRGTIQYVRQANKELADELTSRLDKIEPPRTGVVHTKVSESAQTSTKGGDSSIPF